MPDPIKPNFAARLRILLAEGDEPEDRARETLAAIVGVHANTIGRWLRGVPDKSGDPYVPDLHELAVLAKHFRVSADYLCCLADERNGLRSGEMLVDKRVYDEVMRAKSWSEVAKHADKETGRIRWASDIRAGCLMVPLTEAEDMRGKFDKQVATLQGRKGRKP